MGKRLVMIKRIAILGNFIYPFCSENDYWWTLQERLGIEIVPLQERKATGEQIESATRNCDALMWVHTHGWETTGKPMISVLASLKEDGIPTFGYHLDLWMGLEREKDLLNDQYWHTEYFFTVDKLMADYMNKQPDMPKAFWIRPGVVERDCLMAYNKLYRLSTKDGNNYYEKYYKHDVVFIGSRAYHPEWEYRTQLVDWLEKTYGERFAHYGNDGRGTIRGKALNALLSETRVVVGDSLCVGFDYPYYTSDRIYEITGRGGMIIHPWIRGLETEFVDKEEVAFYDYGDFTELKNLIDHYVENNDEREAMRKAGFERTKTEHTYTQRLAQILDILNFEVAPW
jgi:hypothetical protein